MNYDEFCALPDGVLYQVASGFLGQLFPHTEIRVRLTVFIDDTPGFMSGGADLGEGDNPDVSYDVCFHDKNIAEKEFYLVHEARDIERYIAFISNPKGFFS